MFQFCAFQHCLSSGYTLIFRALNIQYVILRSVNNPPLGMWSLQGEKDWQKYETARRLKKCVDKIRNQYREDWKSKEMKVRQRAVALYFIDKVGAGSFIRIGQFCLQV